MNKNIIFWVLIFCVAGVMLGCNKSSSKSETDNQVKEITVLGSITGDELAGIESCFDAFEEKTGYTVNYQGTKEFENLIQVRVEGGNPPDVAIFPQPGGVIRLVKQNRLVKMNEKTVNNIKKNYGQGWIDLMTIDGSIYGVVHKVSMKSSVWYPKKAWEKAGWKVPTTWKELEQLCDKMVAQGEVPWAVGIESGGATGWVATDWVEDIMLRQAGPEIYDKWVNHEIPFSDSAVKKSVEIMGKMWLTKGYVYGGAVNIPTTNFGDAPKVMFEAKPKAWMHRQADFIINFFPDNIKNNLDEEVGVFALPPIDPKFGTPVLGGGDMFVAFKDAPEVHEFMYYISTGESGKAWAKRGGALFAHKDQDLSAYPTSINRELAKVLMNAQVFRFDASDLMPAEVGAGSFWNEMVEYVNGKDINEVLKAIDASWPL